MILGRLIELERSETPSSSLPFLAVPSWNLILLTDVLVDQPRGLGCG
nr:MAG TPA: hypothetical protein [Caudoviricetes sp.]